MLQIAILVASGILNIILGLLVYSKNPKHALNRLFFLLTGSITLWSVVNYISLHPIWISQLVWSRLVLFSASLLCLLVFWTFSTFPSYTLSLSVRARWLTVLLTAGVMALTLTSLVFKRIVVTNGSVSPVPGFGIPVFALFVVATLGGGVLSLIAKYRHAKGNQKAQLWVVLIGLAGTFGLIFLTNFVLVVLFRYSNLLSFGSSFTLIFSGSFAYAIVKHRLFDIRKAAARGLGYVLTASFLVVLYTILMFGGLSLLLGAKHMPEVRVQVLYTGLALILAFSLKDIKRFFDRISNRLFFKDAYDPQKFLDRLNRVLVAEVDLRQLAERSTNLIEDTLKAGGCALVIRKTDTSPTRVIGTHTSASEDWNTERLEPLITSALHKKIIVTDYLEETEQSLTEALNTLNIAVVVRLVTYTETRSQTVGEMVLGLKKNGDPYSREDIAILSIVANELVIAIQNALRFEEIRQFNATLQKKVADATRRLSESNRRLRELDETKDDFISMASHQLRTPLTSVKGYLSLVLEGDAGHITQSQRKLLNQAFTSSQRMVYLIADLLNVSRLKTGKFVIELTSVNLADLVEDEVNQLIETAQGRSLHLTYHKPGHFSFIELDETKTRQVIMNFIDNAIYYTPAGGHIEVTLLETSKSIELRVVDDGIGVPKAAQYHLFTKFYRANNAQKARPDGTGLGLFMAKKVIVAQGGAIIFSSQEGHGSTFGFSIPKDGVHVTPVVTK